uniref:Transcription-repair coupling factor (Superfamily II helicase) n=1 Tax=Rheinheimera sp. BAL341 TaxID=1708203 RepID=A0A486XPR9_9GAMM
MAQTYLTTEELSSKIKYDIRTIRDSLKDRVLFEGVHYIRPFGGRKLLFIWEKVEAVLLKGTSISTLRDQA